MPCQNDLKRAKFLMFIASVSKTYSCSRFASLTQLTRTSISTTTTLTRHTTPHSLRSYSTPPRSQALSVPIPATGSKPTPTSTPPTARMSTYKGAAPASVSPAVRKFYESFYAISDDPSASTHTSYARAFTPDATMIMGTKKVQGYEEILSLRKGLWSGPVVSRLHTLDKIYAFGEDGMDVMVYGNVKYGLKNGKEVVVDWAGRAELVEDTDGVRMRFYQVYLDGSVVANAMKD